MSRILALTAGLLVLAAPAAFPDAAGRSAYAATSAEGASAAATGSPSGSAREAGDAVVTVRRSRYGRVLFDGRGRALYLFTRERTRTPRCYGACAEAWPPFLTAGRPSARKGARPSLLGTVRRRDGRRQVTYRGRPLYYYVGDRRPGQILCQDVVEFGGRWLVVSPSGRAVR
jgi:predicted lipoprotein with Yx(FWY)xxD motif